MSDNNDQTDEIISTLIESHLKLASITSGLLFACRTANYDNQSVNQELDSTSKTIDEYIEKLGQAIVEFRKRKPTDG